MIVKNEALTSELQERTLALYNLKVEMAEALRTQNERLMTSTQELWAKLQEKTEQLQKCQSELMHFKHE